MEEASTPRRNRDDVTPTNQRPVDVNDLNTDERVVVETDRPTAQPALADRSYGPTNPIVDVQSLRSEAADAVGRLLGWIRSDPGTALGVALGLGLVVGFILRRTVLLSEWEVEEVNRV